MADLFERDGKRGAPPRFERRHMLNACCYALRTGCAWRLLPKTFPPWQATYMSFKRWAAAGVFETLHDRLRQQWRDRIGRAPDPTAAIIDAQSTRSTAQGGNTGFDAGKKVKGRKRHLVVDTLGLLLAVTVTLETAVGRARVGRDAVGWQGVTTLRAHAREEEQRGQRAAAWLNRVRSALTHEVNVGVSAKVNVHAVYPAEESGQLPFLGSLQPASRTVTRRRKLWRRPAPKG